VPEPKKIRKPHEEVCVANVDIHNFHQWSRGMKRELETDLIIFGVVLGMLVGAFTALWYAPLSGRALQRRAIERVQEVRNQTDAVTSSLSDGRDIIRSRRSDEAPTL